jgi:protein SCO1/2
LAYFYYSASQRGKENLDTIEEDITGFKELKHKERAIGGDWTLTNADGLPFSSRNLTGSYYLIYFGYTNCPDICPSSLYYLSSVYRIIRNLPEGAYMKLKLVFVSVDPERDSPKVIKSYLTEFGKNIIGVTGTSEDDI